MSEISFKDLRNIPPGTVFRVNDGNPYLVLPGGFFLHHTGKILDNTGGFVSLLFLVTFGTPRIVA